MSSQSTHLLTILLVLFTCHSQVPSKSPSFQPTLEPTSIPTLEPTPGTTAPTSYPTEIPAKNSFLKIICLQSNDNKIIIYNMNLTEDNGFNDNNYGQSRVDDEIANDSWTLNNVQIPININDENMCYLHIYLSNNDYWGYRNNATCTLSYNINTNNKELNNTKLDLYNILDINQQYNIFWETKFLSNTEYQFGSYPICQTQNVSMDQNIVFANYNVKDVIDSKFDENKYDDINFGISSNDNNDGNKILSNNGFWPYSFHLSSDQQTNRSQIKIHPNISSNKSAQTCFYNEPLPSYDNNSNSNIKNGGIDYFLFISVSNLSENGVTMNILSNLSVNIRVSQFCNVDGPIEIIESVDFAIILSIVIVGLFWLGLCWFFIMRCNRNRNECSEQEMAVKLGEYHSSNDIEEEEPNLREKDSKFVVSQQDHEEMLEMIRKGSLSIGLQQ